MRPRSPSETGSAPSPRRRVVIVGGGAAGTLATIQLLRRGDAALEVETRVPEGQSIFVWGFEPGIYWMSGRPPASRFIYNVPQRAKWERERARDMLMSDLTHNMPAMILVQHGDRFQKVTGNSLDSAQALYTFPQLETFMDRNYSPAGEVAGKFDLYRRSHNK